MSTSATNSFCNPEAHDFPSYQTDCQINQVMAGELLRKAYPSVLINEENFSIYALKYCVDLFRNRQTRYLSTQSLGPVTAITSCLGMGGAERQLALTMAGLKDHKDTNRTIGPVELKGPFEVAVRSLSTVDTSDFVHHIVQRAGVPTHEINNMYANRIEYLTASDELNLLFPFLPPSTAYGVERLVQYFRNANTDVAYIWQDGAVLYAGLAALIADVPKVIFSFRGLPPNLRPHLFNPHYEELYKSLSEIPGVNFACNNEASAEEYCKWLNLPREKFSIIHNGVEANPETDAQQSEKLWNEFVARTSDAKHTVGSVFNFKVDKRPDLWIEYAHAYSQENPDTRFVLVGDGTLFAQAKQRAEELNIADKILFTGASQDVAFWLKQFDAFVLLSKFEGLPNVLVEAQLAGVPVISTPAGGACETFQDGKTGFGLSSINIEGPVMDELCQRTSDILKGRCEILPKNEISHYAQSHFSLDAMLARTVQVLTKPSRALEII